MADRTRRRTQRTSNAQGASRERVLRGAALGALGLTVTAAPLMIGGAFGWSVAVTAALSTVAAGLALVATPTRHRDLAPLLFWMLGLGTLFTALQLTPLPCWLVAQLAPASAQLTREAMSLVDGSSVRCALTLDRGATLQELVRWSALANCALSSYWLCAGGSRTPVMRTIASSATLLAVVALCHQIVEAKAVFGLYVPAYARAELGPLLNPNHLAGLMVLGSPLAWALARGERESAARTVWLLAAVLMGMTMIATSSLGGAVAYACALVAFFGATRRLPGRKRPIAWARVLPLCAVLSGALALILFMRRSPPSSENAEAKLRLISGAARGLTETPWVGMGRGAFRAGYSVLNPSIQLVEYPENVVLHWTMEWGLPVGLAMLGLLLAVLYRSARSAGHVGALTSVIAASAVLLQNLVDFGLETAGIGCPWGAVLGVVASVARTRQQPHHAGYRWVVGRSLLFAGAITTLLGAPLLHGYDRSTLAEKLQAGADTDLLGAMRDVAALHPADPALTLLSAVAAVELKRSDAPRFIERSIRRAPGWAAPHELKARWLFSQGRIADAAREVHQASTRDSGAAMALACATLRRAPSVQTALTMAPAGEGRTHYLDVLTRCPRNTRALSRAIDEQILALDPTNPAALPRWAADAEARGDFAGAEAALRRGLAAHPKNPALLAALAQALIESGRAAEALRICQDEIVPSHPVLRAQAMAEAALGNAEGMRDTIATLRANTASSPHQQADIVLLQGHLELRMGNTATALRAYEEAYVLEPTTDALTRIAHLAHKLGMVDRAISAYDALLAEAPDNAQLRAARQSLDRPTAKGMFTP